MKNAFDQSGVRIYQSTAAALTPHDDVKGARKHFAAVPVVELPCQNSWRVWRATKSVILCSQVGSLCKTSLWSNSFTLAGTQCGHNQKCHQPAVQTQAEELYSYESHRESIGGAGAHRTSPLCIANTVSFVSAGKELQIQHTSPEQARRAALTQHVMGLTW